MRLATAILLVMVAGATGCAFGATGGDSIQTTDFSRRWLRDSINPKTGRLILEITNETIVTNLPISGTGFLHITDDLPDAVARAVDLSTDDIEGDLDVTHLDGGTGANVNTFWRGDGKWSMVPATGVTPTGTGFTHNTGGTQDAAARAVDLSTVDIIGDLDVTHLNGGAGASAMTYWRGDKTWAPITGASGGTVTSVGLTAPTFLNVGGSPITSAGVIALTLSGTPLPIANVGAPSGNGFGHVTGGIWDPAARAVDLSGADVTGIIASARVVGAYTGINQVGTLYFTAFANPNYTAAALAVREFNAGGVLTPVFDNAPRITFAWSGRGAGQLAYDPADGYMAYIDANGTSYNGFRGTFFDAKTGFTISGGAVTGKYLRGNGTAFVSSSLLASDLTGTIPIGSVAAPTGTGFGHVTGGVWDGAARAADLSTADVTGNLAVGNLNSGQNAWSGMFWRGDGTWTNALTGSNTSFTVQGTSNVTLIARSVISGGDAGITLRVPSRTWNIHMFGTPSPFNLLWDTGSSPVMTLSSAGLLDTLTGYSIGGAAATGQYLRGNGTAFVSSSLLASDLTGTIPIASVTAPTGTGFGHVTGGVWDAAARAVDLSGSDATGILATTRLPALTGDVASAAGSAIVNLNLTGVGAGNYGNSIAVAQFNVDSKGRLISASQVPIAFPPGSVVPTGTGFTHITSGAQDAAARAVDLSTIDVTGNLPVSHLNSGAGANVGSVWRGDGTWTNMLFGTDMYFKLSGTSSSFVSVDAGNSGDVGYVYSRNGVNAWLNFMPSPSTDMTWYNSGTKMNLKTTGLLNTTGGYSIGGAAATGQYLRGNGTAFVSSSLLASDLSGTIPIGSVGAPTGTGFGHVTGGVWDSAARAVDLSTADVTGNLPVSKLNSGTSANNLTYWRGDGSWAAINFPPNPIGTGFAHVTSGGMDLNARAVDLSTADVTGNLPVNKLNGGTGANAGTYWRGDGSWQVVPSSGGTVTSVGLTAPAFLNVGGSPVTGVGVINLTLSGTPLPVANVGAPSGTGFGHVTGGVWDAAARAVDLSGADVTGIIASARVAGAYTGINQVGSLYFTAFANGSYTASALTVREFNAGGVLTPTFANAPRMAFTWSGRGASQLAFDPNDGYLASLDSNGTAFNGFRGNLFDAVTGYTIGGAAATGKYLRGNGTAFVSSSLLASDLTGTIPIGSVAAPTGTGFGHVTGGVWDAAAKAVDLSGADATGIMAAARHPALAGDVTSVAGSLTTTLANTAVTPGTYGDATHVPVVTVDGKGRVTAASTVTVNSTGIFPIIYKGTNYTLADQDYTVSSCCGAAITFTLPLAAGRPGRVFIIRGGGSTPQCFIINSGTDLTDDVHMVLGNGSAYGVGAYVALGFQSDGTNWITISGLRGGL